MTETCWKFLEGLKTKFETYIGNKNLCNLQLKIECTNDQLVYQFDELENDNDHVLAGESKISYSESELIGSYDDDDDDDIMITNMIAMSEDLLLDFNRLNGGALFP